MVRWIWRMGRVAQREAAVRRKEEGVQRLLQLEETHLGDLREYTQNQRLVLTPDWFYQSVSYSVGEGATEPYVGLRLVLWNLSVYSVSLASPTINVRMNNERLAQSPSLDYPLPQALEPCSQNHISLRQPISRETATLIRDWLGTNKAIGWSLAWEGPVAVLGTAIGQTISLRLEIRSNAP
jgi:hypothetical protein